MKALVLFAALGVILATPASAQRSYGAHCAIHATRQPPVPIPDPRYQSRRRVYSDDMWMG
jgi:hypothetical protein